MSLAPLRRARPSGGIAGLDLAERQPRVIDAAEVENRRLHVVDVTGFSGDVSTRNRRFAPKVRSGFDAAGRRATS